MDTDTNKLIQDQFDSLPIEIKEALSRVSWKQKIAEIAQREKLSTQQASELEAETLLILYGFLSPENYKNNIMSEVGLEAEAANRITKNVGEEILNEVEKQYEMIEALHPKTKPSSEPAPKQSAPTLIPTIPAPAPMAPTQKPVPISIPVHVETPKPSLNKITFEPKLPEIMPERELMITSAPKVIPVATPTFRPAPITAPRPPTPAFTSTPATIPTPAAPTVETITPVTTIPKPTEEVVSNVKLYVGGKDPYREPLE